MEFSHDQISAIIGAKELEIIGLRFQLAQAQEKIKLLMQPSAEPKKPEIIQ